MAKFDFKTEQGQEKTRKLIREIFRDFDEVSEVFGEYSVTVTVDDVFDFRFTEEDLAQTKRLITLLQLKKSDKLETSSLER